MQDRKRLEEAIENNDRIASLTDDLDTLFELAREGEAVDGDIARELKNYAELLSKLETEMLLSGENDALPAIMTIHPGAGGTESQDWAEMLMRMYLRWAERNNFGTVITDRLEGEGAGIKSVTFEVNGAERLRPAAIGNRRAPAGAHLAVRCQRAAAHVVRLGLRLSADRRRDQDRHQAGRSAHRYLPFGRRGRAARQHDGFGGAHHALSDRHRGAVPERALAAQESRQRDEAAARAAVRIRAGKEARGDRARPRPRSWRSISAARFAATCWRPIA